MKLGQQAIDLTKGHPIKLMLRYATPTLIGSIFQTFYTMTDSSILGRFVGTDALAAVGATSSTISFVLMFALSITNAISIQLSNYVGAGDEVSVRRCIANSAYIIAAIGIIFGAIGFFAAAPIMHLLDAPENIFSDAVLYLKITCGLCIAQFSYNTVANILKAVGDSRTPLLFLIICSILNILLDLLFVVGFKWGVGGAAAATVFSQFLSAVSCTVFMFIKYPSLRPTREEMGFHRGIFKSITVMGLHGPYTHCHGHRYDVYHKDRQRLRQ